MNYLQMAQERLAAMRSGGEASVPGQDAPAGTPGREREESDQSEQGAAAALAQWIAEPIPLYVEPPTVNPTVDELRLLADRLDDYLASGRAALEAAPGEHPHREVARQRWTERRAARTALGDLLAALDGQPYSRERLGAWTAGQLFREGNMSAALEVVDAIHDPR